MKKILPWLIIVVMAGFFVSDHFNGKADLKEMEGAYVTEKAASDAVIAGLRKDIEARDENIAMLNGELDSNATVIEALKEKDAASEAAVIEARKGWAEFSVAAQAKLTELDNAWSARFSLAQSEIKKWEERERIWKGKETEYQLKVSDLKGIIAAKDAQIKSCEDTQKDLAKAVINERRASRIKTWVSGGLFVAGFLAGRA